MTRFRLNGAEVEVSAGGLRRLLDVLREDLGLTGTKEGCGEGECGACTVRIDGRAVNSCLVPLSQVEGCEVETIEGARGPEFEALEELFVERGATQCGICTPGMVLSARALLAENPNPTGTDVRNALAGNLCRCTGYGRIVEAVLEAAKRLREAAHS